MNDELRNPQVTLFLQRLNDLLTQVSSWVGHRTLDATILTTRLQEEGLPPYEAPVLQISTPEHRKVADLVPIGTNIVAAAGRVDLKGRLAKIAFLYYEGNGPTVTFSMAGRPSQSGPMISGVDGDGWYWLPSPHLTAKKIDEELFIDLLRDTSGYALR